MPLSSERPAVGSNVSSERSTPSAPRPLGVAVIGCGYWGPNHLRNFQSLPNCRVTAVDRDQTRLERVEQAFPHLRSVTEFSAVLADPAIDAVVLATPTESHFALARQALEHGKHVLCEKPLCTRASDALQLVQLARRHRCVLMTAHTFLFNPGIMKIKQLIEGGELGTLRYLSAVRTNLGPVRQDVNAAFDLAAHDIAVFNWLVDEVPTHVSCTGGSFLQSGVHDVVFINLQYPNRTIGNIHASWLNPKKVRQMTVVGSQRMVMWDDLTLGTPVAIYDRGAQLVPEIANFGENQRVAMWDGDVRLPKVESEEPLKVQDRYFVDAIRQPTEIRSAGEFSVAVVAVLEAVERSLAEGGRPVEVERLSAAG